MTQGGRACLRVLLRQGSSRLAAAAAAASLAWPLHPQFTPLHFLAAASQSSKLVAMGQAKGAGHS